MAISDADGVRIFAHRGFSSQRPEMTRAAYTEAIEFAAREQVQLGLECDVHFAADDQLICLHDLSLNRTARVFGPAFGRNTDELRALDFGRWGRWADPRPRVPGDGALVTLDELFGLTQAAWDDGVRLALNVETKHPNPRGSDVDDRVIEMILARGWEDAASPIRVISFAPASLTRIGRALPQVGRTLLVKRALGSITDGRLPDGIRVVGPELDLIRADPGFVARAQSRGNEVHVWTVNDPADIEFCLELGVDGLTTDCPDRVVAALHGSRQLVG